MLLKRLCWVAALGAAFGCRTSVPSPESTPDAGAPDASTEVESPYVENPLLPASQWKPVPGLPRDCPDRIAIDPNAAIPPLDWKACSSGRAGCERVDADWSPRIYAGVYTFLNEPVQRIGGKPYITLVRHEVLSPGQYRRRTVVILDGAGNRVFALGAVPEPCVGGAMAGARGVVLDSIPRKGGREYLSFSRWSAPSDFQTDSLPQEALTGGWSPVHPALAAGGPTGAVFFQTGGPPSTAIYDSDAKKVILAKAGDKRLDAVVSVGAGDGALTLTADGYHSYRLGYIDPLGNHAALLDAQPKHYINALTVDRGASAPQMVWVEALSDGGDFLSTEIWTSPLATTSAGVQRRLVAKDPYGSGFSLMALVADRGLVVFKNGLQSARLVRLSDGKGWTIPADADHNVSEIMGITDDSVWILVSKRDPIVQDVTEPTGIQRVRLDSLGEPTVPSGL